MLVEYSIYFIIAALVFAVLGFTNIASGFASVAKILFGIFIILFIISYFF